jgi:hypothetical protein
MTTVTLIPVEDVAEAGGGGLVDLRAAGIEIHTDWRGEPAITIEDARRVVAERRAAYEKQSAEWDAFQGACREWVAGRWAAWRAAYAEARQSAPGHLSPGGADDFARVAANAAAAKYERTVPRPEIHGEPGWGNNCRLEYVREDELGPLGRVKQALRERKERGEPSQVAETVR